MLAPELLTEAVGLVTAFTKLLTAVTRFLLLRTGPRHGELERTGADERVKVLDRAAFTMNGVAVSSFDNSPDRLAMAIARLTDREREVLLLIHRGVKYRQIADQLGIAVSTVKTLARRARARLDDLDTAAAAALVARALEDDGRSTAGRQVGGTDAPAVVSQLYVVAEQEPSDGGSGAPGPERSKVRATPDLQLVGSRAGTARIARGASPGGDPAHDPSRGDHDAVVASLGSAAGSLPNLLGRDERRGVPPNKLGWHLRVAVIVAGAILLAQGCGAFVSGLRELHTLLPPVARPAR